MIGFVATSSMNLPANTLELDAMSVADKFSTNAES